MLNTKSILFLNLLLLGYLSKSNAQTNHAMKQGNFTVEQQNVLKTIEKMVSSFENKDIEGVMATYERNATVVFEPEKPVSDAGVLREMFQGAFGINPKYEFKGHEVFINGDIATHFTPWIMTGKLPDGSDFSQSGLSVAVLRKQSDGSWLIIFDNPHGQYLMEKQ